MVGGLLRLLAVCVALLGLLAPPAGAVQEDGVRELWRDYPLEEQPAATRPKPSAERARPAPDGRDEPGSAPTLLLIVALVATGAAAALILRRAPGPLAGVAPQRLVSGLALVFALVAGLVVAVSSNL